MSVAYAASGPMGIRGTPNEPAAPRDAWVRVADLTIDPRYQRQLQETRINKMAKHWDPRLAGVIEVSRRANGSQVVLDGQHRLLAARAAGIEFVRALVHEGMSPEEEAGLFVRLNTERVRPKFIDIFNARVAAGDEEALAVRQIIESCGFQIPRHSGSFAYPTITAVDAAVKLYRTGGEQLLRDTLGFLSRAWPDDKVSLRSSVIQGVGAFLFYYRGHPAFSVNTAIERLSRWPALKFDQRGKTLSGMGSSGSSRSGTLLAFPGHRDAAVEAYNVRTTRRLPPLGLRELRQIQNGKNPWRDEAVAS